MVHGHVFDEVISVVPTNTLETLVPLLGNPVWSLLIVDRDVADLPKNPSSISFFTVTAPRRSAVVLRDHQDLVGFLCRADQSVSIGNALRQWLLDKDVETCLERLEGHSSVHAGQERSGSRHLPPYV